MLEIGGFVSGGIVFRFVAQGVQKYLYIIANNYVYLYPSVDISLVEAIY